VRDLHQISVTKVDYKSVSNGLNRPILQAKRLLPYKESSIFFSALI
jgi:hypothetical protein